MVGGLGIVLIIQRVAVNGLNLVDLFQMIHALSFVQMLERWLLSVLERRVTWSLHLLKCVRLELSALYV